MKLLFAWVAAAASIVVAPSAFADPPDRHGGGQPHGEHHGGPSNMGGGGPSHMPTPKATPYMRGPAHMSNGPRTWTDHHGMVRTTVSPATTLNRNHNNNYNNNNREQNWSGRGNAHINFNRRNVTAQHHYRYRGGRWYWPHGYSYQRWAFGMTLPSVFWAQEYWIGDYYDYGLAPPPPGCVWVRYGDDAILIDEYSGEILEVVYDQFY